jgi:Tfp pilus assembly PilM family ATPase
VQLSIQDAIREGVEALAREVSLCLRYCAVTFRGLRPTRVTLAGGEVHDPTLVRLLQQSLDCPCVLGEPLRGVDLGRTGLTGNRRGELPEWSVATGLALRDLLEEVDGKVTHEAGRVPA